jgi:urea transport system substrate-binding protein
VINTINGDSNVAFYNSLAAAGVSADEVPVLATSIGEDELRALLPKSVQGHLAAWHYFQSVDTPANREFVARFRHEHGEDRVVGDPMESAYTSVHLWKLAAETAGSFDTEAVRGAFSERLEVAAPGGLVRLDPKTQHLHRFCRIGRIRPDRQFDIVWEAPRMLGPDPFPQDAFPGWRCDWTKGGLVRGQPVDV